MAQIAPPAVGSNEVTSGPPHRAILRLALPTVGAMLTQSIVNEIDIVFFARLPQPESSNAQAALLPSLIILWLFGGSLSAISVGTQAFVGRRFAEKGYHDAGAVLTNAAFFSVLAGIVFSIIGYAATPAILGAMIKNEGARAAAEEYLRWRLLGVTSMVTTFAFKAFFDGIGKTHIHLVSAVVMNALNIVLCWLLIFGNAALGIPKMGIAGAGIAGVASTYLGLAIMLGYAVLPSYRSRYRPFTWANLDRGLTWSVLKLSIPSSVATIAVMTGFALFAAIAGKLDQIDAAAAASTGAAIEPVNGAATTVIVGILKLTFTACLAFGTSTATLVAQSLGEKRGDRAEVFGWTSVRLGLVIFGLVGFLEAAFAPQVLAFVTHSEMVQNAALMPMRVMGICTPVIAVGMILTQALFGAGNTRFVMIVELILHFTCLVPLAWVLGITLGFGLIGIWAAGVVYVALLAGVMSWKFKLGDWKHIAL
ncbi:MATE family efflux transporter [Polyangium aurulentum]|uniref:MATE family efflux transporter n=1 Tax=Polyangium aurulentum TaxID=2567896 RepID=UPI0010AEE82B|nr:MATE family efflux transporter [Polyangium aurulentum]UQA55135.1 MATE family efflux transporter [Polyangium aurulentum]